MSYRIAYLPSDVFFSFYCSTLPVKKRDVVVLASEFGRVGKVKYPGVGNKTYSIFEGLLSFPMCISKPNFAKCHRSRGMPVSNWCLDSKTKGTRMFRHRHWLPLFFTCCWWRIVVIVVFIEYTEDVVSGRY